MFATYRLKPACVISSCLLIGGGLLFLTVVIPLHFIQSNYNPREQLMSELALGAHGSWMLCAFVGLSGAAFGTQSVLKLQQTPVWLRLLFSGVALCFLGAGIFPLGDSDLLHIVCIALAFIGSVLGMVLLSTPTYKMAMLMPPQLSCLFAIEITVSVFAGHALLDIGIAQRLAASGLLAWFFILGWNNWKLCKS